MIGHKAPTRSAIACRIESLNQRRKADRLKQVSGPQRCRPDAIPACDPILYRISNYWSPPTRSVRRALGFVLVAFRQLTGAWVHGSVLGVNLISTPPSEGAAVQTILRPRPRSHPNEPCCVVSS